MLGVLEEIGSRPGTAGQEMKSRTIHGGALRVHSKREAALLADKDFHDPLEGWASFLDNSLWIKTSNCPCGLSRVDPGRASMQALVADSVLTVAHRDEKDGGVGGGGGG